MATTTAPASQIAERRLIDASRAQLIPEALGSLCYDMTAIASPTGE